LLAARLLAKTPTSTHMVAGLAGARRARRRAAQAQRYSIDAHYGIFCVAVDGANRLL